MKRKIGRGKPLEELVKGSLDYTLDLIRSAFRKQFPYQEDGLSLWIVETFADHVIVLGGSELKTDEYYLVSYSSIGGEYTFADRADWEVVELAYQPQTTTPPSSQPELGEGKNPHPALSQSLGEGKRKGKRFTESCGRLELVEAKDGQPRRIKGIGITADVVNENGRRYSAAVLRAAVEDVRGHLHESAGQGRAVLLGEAEHPSSKGGRASLLETVVRWDKVSFDGQQTLLEGSVLETSKGKDLLALMEGGVYPGISQRAYGQSKVVTENGQRIEEVTDLVITGYDLVLEPSDPNGAVTMLESTSLEEGEMTSEEILKLLREHPELFRGLIAENVQQMSAEQAQRLEESLREKLGIGKEVDLPKALDEAVAAKKLLAEQAQQEAVNAAIDEATKALPYGKAMNEAFANAVQAAKPADAESVKTLVEAKRNEYDAIAAQARLASMGYRGAQGSVIEMPEGERPQHLRASLELIESLERHGVIVPHKERSVNDVFAQLYLERFDKLYGRQLAEESRQFEEAEQTSDLNLPYSVGRTVMAQALPTLVASGVFDFGMMDASPSRLYYETYAGEAGATGTVTDEASTADLNAWVALANKRLIPGTVVITNSGATVTYTEGTDYVVDCANGRYMALATITDEQSLLVDYQYDAVRKGEGAAIERGKMTLAYKTIEAMADRLAASITREAIVFSRQQIGWDALARTLNALGVEVAQKIDKGVFYLALAAVLQVANNSGGTWTAASDTLDDLVKKVGIAKTKVANRFYDPTGILVSKTNSDAMSNWDGFTAAGKVPSADLNANGYVGRLKGLPVFDTTQFSDGYILTVNRGLVMHRVLTPWTIKGPFPTYDANQKLVAADQYYGEEFNATEAPVVEKGSYVKIV
jgi:hypothetical protein